MAGPAILQSAIGLGSAANTVSATFATTPGVGHSVLVAFTGWHQDQGGESVADNQGGSNTYTLVVGAGDGTTGSASAYVAKINAASGTFTVTVTASSSHCTVTIVELDQEVSIDGTPAGKAEAAKTTSSINVGTAAAANSLMFFVFNPYADLTVSSWTSPLALVRENGTTGSASCNHGTGAGNITSTGAKTATAGFSTTDYVAVAGLLKGSGGGFTPAPWYWDSAPPQTRPRTTFADRRAAITAMAAQLETARLTFTRLPWFWSERPPKVPPRTTNSEIRALINRGAEQPEATQIGSFGKFFEDNFQDPPPQTTMSVRRMIWSSLSAEQPEARQVGVFRSGFSDDVPPVPRPQWTFPENRTIAGQEPWVLKTATSAFVPASAFDDSVPSESPAPRPRMMTVDPVGSPITARSNWSGDDPPDLPWRQPPIRATEVSPLYAPAPAQPSAMPDAGQYRPAPLPARVVVEAFIGAGLRAVASFFEDAPARTSAPLPQMRRGDFDQTPDANRITATASHLPDATPVARVAPQARTPEAWGLSALVTSFVAAPWFETVAAAIRTAPRPQATEAWSLKTAAPVTLVTFNESTQPAGARPTRQSAPVEPWFSATKASLGGMPPDAAPRAPAQARRPADGEGWALKTSVVAAPPATLPDAQISRSAIPRRPQADEAWALRTPTTAPGALPDQAPQRAPQVQRRGVDEPWSQRPPLASSAPFDGTVQSPRSRVQQVASVGAEVFRALAGSTWLEDATPSRRMRTETRAPQTSDPLRPKVKDGSSFGWFDASNRPRPSWQTRYNVPEESALFRLVQLARAVYARLGRARTDVSVTGTGATSVVMARSRTGIKRG